MGCIWTKLEICWYKDICFLISLHTIACSAVPVTCLNRWVKLESWQRSFFFLRTQWRVPKCWRLTGHLKTKIDRLYVSLFAAKVYYQLSLLNRKHRSWRLVLLLKSFKEIEDSCNPSPLFESCCQEMSSVLDELFSWPLFQKLLQMKFTLLQPFHLAANNEQIVPKSPLMKTVRIY